MKLSRRDLMRGNEWENFGKHLEYLTLHKKNPQCRLIRMWENANTKDQPEGPEVIFEEIEISEKLFEQFREMIKKEKTTQM